MKSKNGITLIALVITVIVLIILAGVGINMTLGSNGIFTKAQYAKEQYEMAAVREKLNLAILEVQTEEINNGELTLDTMLTKLQGKLPGIEITKDGETLRGNLDSYDFVIDSDFKVTIEGYNPEAGNGGSGKEPELATYTVTFNGENVTSSGANTVQENASYTTTLTPAEDYKITAVTVKMGDTTLTQGTHYTYENGSIIIASVTGNLSITVATEKDNVPTISAPSEGELGKARTGNELPFTWEELDEIAKTISNNSDTITSQTSEFKLGYKGTEYTIGVGDYTTVTYNDASYTVRILGFNHDELTTKTIYNNADGSTNETAGISFIFEDILMKETMVDTTGKETNNAGWARRTLRTTLNGTTKTSLSNSEQIKQVQKIYLLGNKSADNSNKTSDYLWLLSCSEIWNAPYDSSSTYTGLIGMAKASEGEQYKYYKEEVGEEYANVFNTCLEKNYRGVSNGEWWLRSPHYKYTDDFCFVNSVGACAGGSTEYYIGVAPGFSI